MRHAFTYLVAFSPVLLFVTPFLFWMGGAVLDWAKKVTKTTP